MQFARAPASFDGPRQRSRLDLERTNTPRLQVEAIRALQTTVSAVATRHFETDGSYHIDVALFSASKALR
jgi:hypothetical protein